MLYRRGEVWWFRLKFAGTTIRESSKSRSKAIARRAERKRLQELEEGFNGLRKRLAPLTFAVAADWPIQRQGAQKGAQCRCTVPLSTSQVIDVKSHDTGDTFSSPI